MKGSIDAAQLAETLARERGQAAILWAAGKPPVFSGERCGGLQGALTRLSEQVSTCSGPL